MKSHSDRVLARVNPLKLAQCFDNLCGKIENIIHLKTGSINVTCRSIEQVHTLLKITKLELSDTDSIPITVSIAMANQTSSDKICAPELSE